MSDYPAAAPSFTPKVDGVDYPQAIDINELQEELTAIGTALVTGGLAHDLDPDATAGNRDFGSTSKQWRQIHGKLLNVADASELTIATGAITATQSYHRIDTESDAASDDLDTITAGTGLGAGALLVVRAENVARVVTLKDGSGNLLLMGDYALSATDRLIILIYDGTNWREIARSSPASATSVTFPATQVPSADANTLDDYEEGTWTPSDGSGAGLSFTTVEGHYVKVGQMVTVAATLTFPSTVDGTAAKIGGLPFAVQNSTNNIWGALCTNTTSTATYIRGVKNTTTATLHTATSFGALTNANMSTFTITFTFTYRATA